MLKPKDAPSLRHVLSSGEAMQKVTLEAWRYRYRDGPGAKHHASRQSETSEMALFNAYGQTETTVSVAIHGISACAERTVDPACIGTVIAGGVLYIVDPETLLLVNRTEVGRMGELCYSGIQLARGYIDREKTGCLTCGFTENPYHRADDGSRSMMYRTGDMAAFDAQGHPI